MNLSFAMCDSAKESHICMGNTPPQGCSVLPVLWETISVSLLTAPVARGQKPPVGPASSDDGCTVNVRKNTVCRGHVVKRCDHGTVRH